MIKIILVPVDGSDRSVKVLDTALIIAKRFDSHIKVVHVSGKGSQPFMFSEMPAALREQFNQMNKKMSTGVVDGVKKQFKDFCQQGKVRITRKPSSSKGVSASLHVIEGDAQTILAREARLVDVIAMSRPEKHRIGGAGVGELHESLMMNSGRPVLIVPPDWVAHRADHAAIGWNDSVEASRALALTLPWLVQMKKVTVVVSKKREPSAAEVMEYLKRHGCRVEKHVITNGGNVGKKMLAACDDTGAEFLVVGGFSHTRTRQRFFGGVTSYLLANTDVITVMAH